MSGNAIFVWVVYLATYLFLVGYLGYLLYRFWRNS